MSTICKTCGKHKQKVRCPYCSGISGFFRSSCERCNSTKYILKCPDQEDHDLDERMEQIGRELRRRERNRDRIEPKTYAKVSWPKQPSKRVCDVCGGKGFIPGAAAPTTPNYWVKIPCPKCR